MFNKNLMKRLISVSLAGILCLGLVACGEAQAPAAEPAATEETVAEEPVKEEAVEEAAPEEEEVKEPEYELNKNMLDNGGFDYELARWGTYFASGGKGTLGAPSGEGKIKIPNSGRENYSVQVFYDGFKLLQGAEYELSFDIRSTIPRNMEVRIQINGGDYHAYMLESVDVTEEMETYTYRFVMNEGSDPAPRLCFNLGTPEDMDEPFEEHMLYLDNVSLMLVDDSGLVVYEAEDKSVDVNCNQVGFLPEARKTAVSKVSAAGDKFDVVDDKSGSVVYSGTFGAPIKSKASDEEICQADFSDFKTPGTYRVVLADGTSSHPFEIGATIYDDLLRDSFLFLYSQRCGMEITKDLAGNFAHPECHMGDAEIYGTNKTKKVVGGWHDAGDYGRYIVAGAVTVADLFDAYEDAADIWNTAAGDSVGIPESGNGVPDILDEAKYEVDWMLMMQDEASGGVYHKISCREFPGFVMPQEETEPLVLSPISNAATGDFAAICAKSSVLYADIDADFAAKCLAAAKKAWKYLEDNPKNKGFKNPEDILTGEYPDSRDVDERYWAAIELYKATGEEKYNEFVAGILDATIKHGYGWAQVSSYANMSYLNMDESLQNAEYVKKLQDSIIEEADEFLENVKTDGYMCALGDNYSWGSNMTVSDNARIMLDAYRLTGKADYSDAAYDQLSYLLGQNPVSYCYLSGYGTVSPEHAHHRPSMATGYVLPGMVAGGANKNCEDPYAKAVLSGLPAAKCYADNDQAYSVNEVTIYWNSPFIYLLSYEMGANK